MDLEEETSTDIYGYIYKFIFPNGKLYIGLTVYFKKRMREHKCSAKNSTCVVYSAIRKYGWDKIKIEIIDHAETKEELSELEKYYIKKYNTSVNSPNSNGYNMTIGGEGTWGYKFTEEDKKKISKAKLKYYEDNPDAREKISKALLEYYENNSDAREKNSKAILKYYEDNPDAREKNSKALLKYYEDNPDAGKEHGIRMKKHYEDNPYAREKCSNAQKKRYEDNPEAGKKHGERIKKLYEEEPERKQKMAEITRAYFKNNPEAREKASQKTVDYYKNNPDAGKEHSKRMKKWFEDPDNRKKCSTREEIKPFNVYKKGEFIGKFEYQFEVIDFINQNYNINVRSNIGSVLSGKRNHTGGFTFKYIEAEDRG